MQEMDVIKHAKTYIEKLANGIDPITGNPIPDNEVVNQVRISRCLFYVSDLLDKIIDNGGISSAKIQRFSMTSEQANNYVYSTTPIPISKVAERLGEAAGANTKAPSTSLLNDWLEHLGVLEVKIEGEQKNRVPTEYGRSIGVVAEQRTSNKGHNYVAVLHTQQSQAFILSHIEDFLQFTHHS